MLRQRTGGLLRLRNDRAALAVSFGRVRTPATILLLLLTCDLASAANFTPLSGHEKQIELIEQIRGRRFSGPVTRRTIQREQMRDFLRGQFARSIGYAPDRYLSILHSLHLIGEGGKNFESILDLYDSQVLAFYDPIEHVYYSLDRPPYGLPIVPLMADSVAIHELVHALQDQQFDAGAELQRRKNDWDAQLAYMSVIEGEATLVMLAAVALTGGRSLDDLVADDTMLTNLAVAAAAAPAQPIAADAYFLESMKFPYLDGLRLVVQAYRRGGWSAVDELHRDPPATTEEVLHPDLYFQSRGSRSVVSRPLRDAIFRGTLGEFNLRHLVGEQAASGWNGDAVAVYERGGKRRVELDTSWDSERDAEEFAAAYASFLTSRGERNVVINCSERSVRVRYGALAAR